MSTALTILLGIAVWTFGLFALLGLFYAAARWHDARRPAGQCFVHGCTRPSMPGLTVCLSCRNRRLEPSLKEEVNACCREDEYAPGQPGSPLRGARRA